MPGTEFNSSKRWLILQTKEEADIFEGLDQMIDSRADELAPEEVWDLLELTLKKRLGRLSQAKAKCALVRRLQELRDEAQADPDTTMGTRSGPVIKLALEAGFDITQAMAMFKKAIGADDESAEIEE